MNPVIYPPQLNTDLKKLHACWSLQEQMRLEHNKAAAIARANPDKYLKTGKFRTYARESKAKLKLLLAEQNRLKEAIRPANWQELVKQTLDNNGILGELDKSIFGDRAAEKLKPTKAVSYLLDELKALSLDKQPKTLGLDPTENFTTYTEVDPDTTITKTADRITFAGLTMDSDAFVYYDKGAAHFAGDFEHLFKYMLDDCDNGTACLLCSLANQVDDFNAIWAEDDDIQCFEIQAAGDPLVPYTYVIEVDGGDFYYDYTTLALIDTVHFVEFERDDDGGGGTGLLTAYVCTTAYYDDGGDLVDTLSLNLHTQVDFRYIYGLQSTNTGSSLTIDGYIELLDLQEAAAGISIPIVMQQMNQFEGGSYL